ncbi:hypothetical protein OAN84_08990 [Planktomarina temperata]|nr:hypothetical protein [Planktomarina temperata]
MERVVICMKWGDLYGPDYVNVLFNAVCENLAQPFRFVCLTDCHDELHPDIEIFPIPDIGCTPEMWKHGAWPKLSVFASDLYGLAGRALFIDMDTVICGQLDKLFKVDAPFVAIDTSDNWRPGGEPGKGNALVGTGIFAFDIGCQSQILTEFQKNPQLAFETCKLEQVWVQKKASSIDFWPLDWVISFKRWLRRPIGLDIFMAPKKPLEGASIVAFHGNPRPISLVRSTWRFWDSFPHMGYGRVPWMRDYWTLNGGKIPK